MRFAHLIALLLLVPLAGADHLIHHRLYVVGRVLDASGLPAPGLPVEVEFEGVAIGGSCFDLPDAATGPRGDVDLCRHVHPIPPGASVTITVADASARVPIDPLARDAVAYLRLAGPAPARDIQGDRDFDRTFRVVGGAYNLHERPVMTEEDLSDLTARGGENVTVRMVVGNETVAEATRQLDERGRYAVDLEVREVPEDARVRVEVAGKQEGTEASALFRRADVSIVRDLRTIVPTARPGDDVPLSVLIAVGALGIVALASRRLRS